MRNHAGFRLRIITGEWCEATLSHRRSKLNVPLSTSLLERSLRANEASRQLNQLPQQRENALRGAEALRM